jgi:hypothetical protein
MSIQILPQKTHKTQLNNFMHWLTNGVQFEMIPTDAKPTEPGRARLPITDNYDLVWGVQDDRK